MTAGYMSGVLVALGIFLWQHADQLSEASAEVLGVGEATPVCHFRYVYVCLREQCLCMVDACVQYVVVGRTVEDVFRTYKEDGATYVHGLCNVKYGEIGVAYVLFYICFQLL